MNIRIALPTDLEIITNIAFLAFENSPLYDHFSPLHTKYPLEFRRFLRDELRLRMISPGQVIIVAETYCDALEFEDEEVEKDSMVKRRAMVVTGYAVWIKRTAEDTQDEWNGDTLLKKFHRMVLTCQLCYHTFLGLDKTTDYPTIHNFHKEAASILASSNILDHIELNTLAVHPDYQRMGIGADLMDWGMQRARDERLSVVLEATEAGVCLYERKGFEVVGTILLERKIVEDMCVEMLKIPVMVLRTK